jgi:hypothetical protein
VLRIAIGMTNINDTISDLAPAACIAFSGRVPSPAVKSGCGGAVALAEITKNDVILGRGSNFDKHNGNVQLRHFVLQSAIGNQNRTLSNREKTFQAARIVATIRNLNPSGRFLAEDKETGLWEEVGNVKARRRVAQTFRYFHSSAMKKASAERNQSEVVPVVQKGSSLLPAEIKPNDVLLGRGARKHPGNQYFHQLIVKNLADYHNLTCTHIYKTQLTARVVAAVRQLDPPSRFLRKNKEKGIWEEVGDAEARKKVAQAFRDYRHYPKSKIKCGKHEKVLSRPIQIKNNDVLLGRGAHKHAGNVQFRQIVAQYFATFFEYQGKEKTKVAAKIVEDIHNLSPPGRFMTHNKELRTWEEVKDPWAIKKVVQAFRDLGRPEK